MKILYSGVLAFAMVTLISCYGSRITTVQDRDGKEREVKTVRVGSVMFPSLDIIYSGRSGNMVFFNTGFENALPGLEPSPHGYTKQYAYDLSKSDTLNIFGRSIRVIASTSTKFMFIDYTQSKKYN